MCDDCLQGVLSLIKSAGKLAGQNEKTPETASFVNCMNFHICSYLHFQVSYKTALTPPPEPPVSFWAALEFGLEFLVSMSVLLFCDHVFNKSLLPLDTVVSFKTTS